MVSLVSSSPPAPPAAAPGLRGLVGLVAVPCDINPTIRQRRLQWFGHVMRDVEVKVSEMVESMEVPGKGKGGNEREG